MGVTSRASGGVFNGPSVSPFQAMASPAVPKVCYTLGTLAGIVIRGTGCRDWLQKDVPDMPANLAEIERKLWDSADQLRANSGLRANEYSVPVLGLIFLRFADYKFLVAEAELK